VASPLAPYINGRFLTKAVGTVTKVDGRFIETPPSYYLVKLFIKRAQYGGVSSGSRNIPLESQLGGEMLPGASGDQFYYRGYALEYSTVNAGWDIINGDESVLTFTQVTEQADWLLPGAVGEFKFGDDPIMPAARIQRSSGVFGGLGIDQIVYQEIGGVEVQLTGGELRN
jgi:hypothetical protein